MEIPLSILEMHHSGFLQQVGLDMTSLRIKLVIKFDVHVLALE